MSDVSYIAHKEGRGQNITPLKKYVCIEAVVDKDDTITVKELTTIDAAYAYALDDADVIDVGTATNVVTINEDPCTDERIILLVVGS